MGMDLDFIGAEHVPEDFQWRFARRSEFWNLWLDESDLRKQLCDCPPEKCYWGCDEGGAYRVIPEKFSVVREKMRAANLDPIFFEIVDWLEKNPEVYVNYS